MSDEDGPEERSGYTLETTLLAGVMLLSFGYLVFFQGFSGSEFASGGALLALPFCFGAVLTLGTQQYSPLGCLAAPLALAMVCYVLVQLGMEGLICVLMVLPIWIVAGLGGGLAALYMCHRTGGGKSPGRVRSVGLAVLPFVLIQFEAAAPPEWQSRTVERSVVIEAQPEKVWPHLVSIPTVTLDEGVATFSHDLAGIPRPRDARLVRRDGLLVREGRWGAGIRFDEIVEHVDEGRQISWRFSFPDPSLQQTIDRHISPDGPVLEIANGAYRLEPIDLGRTRVTLSTTYRMRTRLGWYFGWWGEQMLGDIQSNILAIVAGRAV